MSSLIPPDMNRCQAEKPNGHTFMTLGGRPGRERCTDLPAWLATEKEPAPDGQIGSMSLCDDCRAVFLKQVGPEYAVLSRIERTEHDSARKEA